MTLDADAKAALAAWKKKDAPGTVAALERALVEARAAAPLDVRQAVVILHPHTGLGLYTPAPGDVVSGRSARLYVEVANHTHAPAGAGAWHVQLDVSGDFAFEDTSEGALELVKLPTVALGTQAYETRTPAGVTSFGVELKLGDKSPAGIYRLQLTVNDVLGKKTATRATRLVLR